MRLLPSGWGCIDCPSLRLWPRQGQNARLLSSCPLWGGGTEWYLHASSRNNEAPFGFEKEKRLAFGILTFHPYLISGDTITQVEMIKASREKEWKKRAVRLYG